MLLIGLLLAAATAAFTGLVISDNMSGGPDFTVTVLGNDIATVSTLEAFCAGLALALIFGLAMMMAAWSTARARRKAVRRRDHEVIVQAGTGAETGTGAGSTASRAPGGRRRRHLFGH